MSDQPSGSKCVLLVEDNEDNAAIYKAVLEFSGYEVVHARDGLEAVHFARKCVPSLILMDISLPKVDGWEATAAIKQNPKLQHIPVLALTAHAFEADRVRARQMGFTGYMVKPVEPRRVLLEVRLLIGEPPLSAA
jgi:two-component system, cell cycle response regulator DivK